MDTDLIMETENLAASLKLHRLILKYLWLSTHSYSTIKCSVHSDITHAPSRYNKLVGGIYLKFAELASAPTGKK